MNASAAVSRTEAGDELLAWYDRHARVLPWRTRGPARPDPYRVWLSEIMLQQTTVATVAPYFQRFTARWPTITALAEASLDDVLSQWAGLGYYARARNLHRCAGIVAAEFGGRFPESEGGLRALPGVGAYTAAAIAAIAFGRHAVVVDGNVERVMARLFAIAEPLPAAKARLRAAAASLTPGDRAGDYAQAVMDLGATVCTPRQPRCMICPWAARCAARGSGDPGRFPVKGAKTVRPSRHGIAFLLVREDGAVWLRRRPERGLLGGMLEVPTTPWEAAMPGRAAARDAAPAAAGWRELPGRVSHTFTHFELSLKVWLALEPASNPDNRGMWVRAAELAGAAVPTAMRKVIARGLASPAPPARRKDSRPALHRS